MAKNSITDYDNIANNNTDIQSVDIAEGCAPSGINNAIRELMADLADVDDGTVALTSPVLTSADINGGTIDGTVIGGTTPAAGTFTTGQFNTSLNVTGTVTADGLTVQNSGTTYLSVGSTGGSGATLILDGSSNGDFAGGDYSTIQNISNKLQIIGGTPNAPIELQTHDGGGNKLRQTIASNGDISFYEDTGTTAKLFWDASTERLGVGTTSPSNSLHVNDGIQTDGVAGSASVFNEGGTTADFRVESSGNTHMLFVDGGLNRVGIGTTSPSSKLDVRGAPNTTDDPALKFQVTIRDTATAFNATPTSGLHFSNVYNSSGSLAGMGGITVSKENATDGNFAGALALYTRPSGGAVTERMRIDSSGNVGIGTTSPATALDVNGTINVRTSGYQFGRITTNNVDTNNGGLTFQTISGGSFSERMRIDSSGNVLVAKSSVEYTSVGFALRERGELYATADGFAPLLLNRLTSDGAIASFRRSGATVGTISVTTSSTAYNTSSDYRLKENVTGITDGIERVKQLNPSRFNFISDPEKTVDGFLAHEAQAIVPEAITGEKDAVDADGNPEYQGIDQSKLVPLLTAALQEAITKIEDLEAKVTALENA